MSSKSKVCFFFEKKTASLRNRTKLKKFLESFFRKEGIKLSSLNYVFCSDKQLLAINRQFLNHDFYTDIITFDLSEGEELQGEIYISIDRVRENARNLGTTIQSELHRVIFHGLLHLTGLKDNTPSEKKKMRTIEEFLLNQYFG